MKTTSQGTKRKASDGDQPDSQQKRRKQWRVPRSNDEAANSKSWQSIEPGDSGVWATCDKGREGKCIGEIRDLFAHYAEEMYSEAVVEDTSDGGPLANGIESDIKAELSELSHSRKAQLFTPLRLDVQCVVFIKTESPVDPVQLVKRICHDAMTHPDRKRTRFVKRLTPMTLLGRASDDGLEKVAASVLAPHFHQQPFVRRKFAIRPNLRNHNTLSRDSIIKQVATVVGPGHEVDLKDYDLLIIVEVYKNVCGMSVVDNSFDSMKRYNIAEIFNPTPRDENTGPAERLNAVSAE